MSDEELRDRGIWRRRSIRSARRAARRSTRRCRSRANKRHADKSGKVLRATKSDVIVELANNKGYERFSPKHVEVIG
jgi:hypothetical protein